MIHCHVILGDLPAFRACVEMSEGRLPAITAEDAPSGIADLIRDCWRTPKERPPMATIAKRLRVVHDEVTSVAGASASPSGPSVHGGQCNESDSHHTAKFSGVGFSLARSETSADTVG